MKLRSFRRLWELFFFEVQGINALLENLNSQGPLFVAIFRQYAKNMTLLLQKLEEKKN